MVLLKESRNEIICDLAETYHIFDMKALPPSMVAVLVLGLRSDSRTVMKYQGIKETNHLLLLASISDSLLWIRWSMTKDGQNGKNMPESMTAKLIGQEEKQTEKESEITFSSGEEFKAYREKLIRGDT